MLSAIKAIPCALTQIVLIKYFSYLAKAKGLFKKKNLKNEHAFITGAGCGLGKTIAKILSRKGVKITIADVNTKAAEDTSKEINSLGGKATFIYCDVSKPESVALAAKHARSLFGPPTILINNAGIVRGKEIEKLTQNDIELTTKINQIAHFITIKEFLPDMLSQNKGHIVTISSNAGLIGVRMLSDYCASKFAVMGLDEALRVEMKSKRKNIKTTCICPYYINTGMFDGVKTNSFILPLLDMNRVAERIVLAIEQEEEMVTVPFITSLIPMLRTILSVKSFDRMMKGLGISASMEDFKGSQSAKL